MLDAFADWRHRADDVNLLEAATKYGATLKRSGREHVGPCPACGGRDRFSVNLTKHKWFCRGHGGGHGPVGMVQHIAGLSFLQACEELTGESCPTGPARPLSEAEQAERNRRRIGIEVAQMAREAEQERYQEDTRESALAIWDASESMRGTLAETYLATRGIVLEAYPDVLRFHPSLAYPNRAQKYPVLVCRVDDLAGDLTAIWRIYLRGDGRKADVPSPKLGLGPASGGAVRIGGIGRKVAIGEGLESALGYWLLTGQKYPAWAALSTAGLVNFEAPLGVEHVCIAPDGDRPIKRHGDDYVPAVPAGRKAAEALRSRLLTEGIACTIAAEPPAGTDYLDMWNRHQREVA